MTDQHPQQWGSTSPEMARMIFPVTQSRGPGVQSAEVQYPFRLLGDEVVLGEFPVARATRPLGKLASYLFVTDSRIVYAAEAKTVGSSSRVQIEYHIQKIDGVGVSRSTRPSSPDIAVAIGCLLNALQFVGAGLLSAFLPFSGMSSGRAWLDPVAAAIIGLLGLAGAVVAFKIATRARNCLEMYSDGGATTFADTGTAQSTSVLALIVLFLLASVFGPLFVLFWAARTELGLFQAEDAPGYSNVNNVDHISHTIGAFILDIKARGKFADKMQ